MSIPLTIICLTSFAGIFLWSGMDYSILALPASYHDVIYILILALAINPQNGKQPYHLFACWYVAGLFIIQSLLQIFDLRPAGETGTYQLYADNILNSIYILLYLFSISILVVANKARFGGQEKYLFSVLILFLAFNSLLTFDFVRDGVKNYALIYDSVYYVALYAITLSTCGPINEFVCSSYNRVRGLLHISRFNIQ